MFRIFIALIAFPLFVSATTNDFIYPTHFEGRFVKGEFEFFRYGTGKHRGYISVFNFPREQVETLLPPQFALAKTRSKMSPVIILWGEMVETWATVGHIKWHYPLTYREWQVYVPGVYRKDGSQKILRTYVPRILVDAYEPEVLGRKFFYKKIQTDTMAWAMNRGLDLNEFGQMSVSGPNESPLEPWNVFHKRDSQFQAIVQLLAQTDILGENGSHVAPRCSGFRWRPDQWSRVRKAKVSMFLEREIVAGMASEMIQTRIDSLVTFEIREWLFDVNYEYNNCP